MRTSLLDPIHLSILHSSSSCVCVSKSPLRRLPSVLAAVTMLLLLASASLQAQSYSGGQDTRALITQSINESKLVALPGNTHPAATPANDRGAVSDSLPLEHLQLQLQRPPELEQKLEKFLAEQQRQGSPVSTTGSPRISSGKDSACLGRTSKRYPDGWNPTAFRLTRF